MDGGERNEVGVGILNSSVRRKAARWSFELDSMFEMIDDGGGAERKKERKVVAFGFIVIEGRQCGLDKGIERRQR